MNRTFAISTMALISMAPALFVGAALMFNAVAGKSPSEAGLIQQADPIHQTTVGRPG